MIKHCRRAVGRVDDPDGASIEWIILHVPQAHWHGWDYLGVAEGQSQKGEADPCEREMKSGLNVMRKFHRRQNASTVGIARLARTCEKSCNCCGRAERVSVVTGFASLFVLSSMIDQ